MTRTNREAMGEAVYREKADHFVDLAYKWVEASWGFRVEAEYARLALRDALIKEFSEQARQGSQDTEMDEELERGMAEESGDAGGRAWSVFNICAERDAAVAERDHYRAQRDELLSAVGVLRAKIESHEAASAERQSLQEVSDEL